jgi:thiamine-phosphate pyrophosphorylase
MRHRAQGVSRQAAPDTLLSDSSPTRGEVGAKRRLGLARLYVITPDASPEDVLAIAAAAVRGGADAIQLRHKTLPRGELFELARRVREIVGDCLFIVNDHVDIALLSGADGVHLGPDDLSVASARKVAGDRLLIGVSASTVEAIQPGADYAGCGPAFATPLKPEKKVIGPAGVAAVAAAVDIPVFAIGGIDETNLHLLTQLGVRRACAIRAVAGEPDPEAAARNLRAILTS